MTRPVCVSCLGPHLRGHMYVPTFLRGVCLLLVTLVHPRPEASQPETPHLTLGILPLSFP